ncbi:MAG: alpha/beta hydrolase [Anaerolineae bacterium]
MQDRDREGIVSTDDGIRLQYHLLGDGPDTVVIPLACQLLEDLRPLAKGRRLISYDPRGRGQSDRDPRPEHIWTDYEVRDLETLRQYFDLEQMALVGWSALGGIVALYGAQYRDLVSRMVLMCPLSPRSPAPYDDPEAARRKEAARIDPEPAARLREMMNSGQHVREAEWFCREFQRVIVPRQMGRPEALARMKSDPCAHPNEWWHNLHQHHEIHAPPETRSNYDWRELVGRAVAPALVVHGTEDLIPVDSSREWTEVLPQARLLAIEGAGHYPHLEAPEAFFPAVERFLDGRWPDEAI